MGRRLVRGVVAVAGLGGFVVGCGSEGSSSGLPARAAVDAPTCADDAAVLAFTQNAGEEGGDVAVVLADGRVRQLSDDGGTYAPSLSPDGTQVAVVGIGPGGEVSDTFGPAPLDLYVLDVDGAPPRRMASTGTVWSPAWSPDGTLIAYARRADDPAASSEIYVISARGAGAERRFVEPVPGTVDAHPAWSPDGDRFAFVRYDREAETSELVVADVVDGRALDGRTVLEGDDLGEPTWAPDGRHVAISTSTSQVGGKLRLVAVDGGEDRWLPAPVRSPSFAPDGRLFGYGRPPAVSDASGGFRVAEWLPDDDAKTGFAVGLPVPDAPGSGFLYGAFRVDAARCVLAGGAALTDGVEPISTIDVVVPSTGETVTVLGREELEGLADQVWVEPRTDAFESKLVEVTDVRNPDIEGNTDAPLLWYLRWADGEVAIFDAVSGTFQANGGGQGGGFDEVDDLAPA